MSSQNRFCSRCGTAVPSLDSKFCSSCGSRLTVALDEPTEEPTSSAPRGAVAGGGGKGIPLARIILALVSLFFLPFGVGVGLWYLLKKKERGFGGLLLGLAIMPLLLVSLLSSDNASDSDNSTGDVSEITSTATPTPAPTATATPTPAPTQLETEYGITNTIRAKRICREFVVMVTGVSEGTHSYEESRTLMKKMYELADPSIASSLRTLTRDMLSAWTQNGRWWPAGDQEAFVVAMESLGPICALVLLD